MPIILVVALIFSPALHPGMQTPTVQTLPADLRAHLTDDRFGVVTSIRGLPLGVRERLQSMFGTMSLDIAEPGAPFRVTDVVVDATLPTRRLVLAACSIDHCLVYYERGGLAHTWHLAMFHWTPEATRLEWGGIAPARVTTIEGLRKSALSGSIRPSKSW